MKQLFFKTTMLVLTFTILSTATVYAFGDKKGRPQGPPPEAIEACEGKAVGDAVEFTGRRGETLEATCQEIDGQLVAVPDNRPKRGGQR